MKKILLALLTDLILLGILVGILFLFLDFHIARSRTNSGFTLSTASAGEGLPGSMQEPPVLSIAVVGDSRYSHALGSVLKEQLQAAPYIAGVNLLDSSPDHADAPYLFVDPGDLDILWTPVYARADLTVQAALASDGDVSLRGQQPVELDSQDGPVIKSEGDFNVQDFTWGLISRPAYYNLIARRVSGEIQRALEPLFQPK
jgi:hypothetical protein